MEGDCPPHQPLTTSVSYPNCHQQRGCSRTVHGDYKQIIDDLTTDLDSLSCQVNMVQREFYDSDELARPFEASLKVLEQQNDRLQKALTAAMQENAATEESYRKSNDELKGQITEKNNRISDLESYCQRLSKSRQPSSRLGIACLRCVSQQESFQGSSGEEIQEIRRQLDCSLSQIESLKAELEDVQCHKKIQDSDVSELKIELEDTKRRNYEQCCHIKNLSLELRKKRSNEQEMSNLFQKQSTQLRDANVKVQTLQESFCQLKKNEDEHSMERNLLRGEVLALREKEACLLGKQKSLHEQLVSTGKELDCAREAFQKLSKTHQQAECIRQTNMQRLQETSNNVKREYNALIEDYNMLQDEYEKLKCIHDQDQKLIESFRKWKDEQLIADKETQNRFQMLEDHIKDLLEEKESLMERIREMHQDHEILIQDLQRLKDHSFNVSLMQDLHNPFLQRVRQTSRRVSEQTASLRDGTSSQMSCKRP